MADTPVSRDEPADGAAPDELSPADVALLADVSRAMAHDPMPPNLLAACAELVTWVGIDDELTDLLVAGASLAGVRAVATDTDPDTDTDPGTAGETGWEYTLADGDLAVSFVLDGSVLRGSADGDRITRVRLETRDGVASESDVDEFGEFRLVDVPRGIARLRIDQVDRAAVTEWFVI